MTDIDKFCSDADRMLAKAAGAQNTAKMASGLTDLFLVRMRDYGNIGTDLAVYWTDHYKATLVTDEGRKAAVEWFSSVLSLLSGCFTVDMDFPDNDWNEIRETVSAEAECMDMNTLTEILTVIVDRGKA
jgi:hypothetical protein